ncbi:DUF4276 family protein [bacterium]|nr:DUF4276 family protein [FCB group bacterium]MBL7190437.1 DUF4276 family protein [bacterium]
MIRINFLVEGQTEETFIRDVLIAHLALFKIFGVVRCVETSHKFRRVGGKELRKFYRGGSINYEKMKNDLIRWMKQEKGTNVFFTTMIDLYRIPNNFPNFEEARKINDVHIRVEKFEQAFKEDIAESRERFLPHIQPFEFEALLFSNPSEFIHQFPDEKIRIDKLSKINEKYQNPEFINDNNPPSYQIKSIFVGYSKVSDGPIIAEAIGLDEMRKKCPHFNEWIKRLETLNSKPAFSSGFFIDQYICGAYFTNRSFRVPRCFVWVNIFITVKLSFPRE